LPGYENLEVLGRGGMGVVYKATQKHPRRVVALKMVLAGTNAGADELGRFRNEIEAVARLHHPHIVQIYEVGECEQRPFFSMEFADAGTLAQKLQGTPLPVRQAARDGDRNANVTVRELLDRAAREIEGKFAGHEATEAAIRVTLGEAYRALGDYAQAQKHLERSLALRRQKLGDNNPDTFESMNNLGTIYMMRGRYDEAEALHKEALDLCRRQRGADHPQTLAIMTCLATLYQARGRYDEAEPLFRQALEGCRIKLGADDRVTLFNMRHLAVLYQARGRYDEAESLFKQALESFRSKLGADHPLTLSSMNLLAVHYQARSRYDEAEALHKQVLKVRRAKLGANHPDTLQSMNNLTLNLLQQKKYADAEPIARECLAIRDKKEPEAWTTFNTRSLLGGALLGQNKYAEAEPLLLAGYEGMKQRKAKIPNEGKLRLTEALDRLVQLYDALGKKDESAKWRKELDSAQTLNNRT
jgi:tetratricopeptide (TPR) repeat protein